MLLASPTPIPRSLLWTHFPKPTSLHAHFPGPKHWTNRMARVRAFKQITQHQRPRATDRARFTTTHTPSRPRNCPIAADDAASDRVSRTHASRSADSLSSSVLADASGWARASLRSSGTSPRRSPAARARIASVRSTGSCLNRARRTSQIATAAATTPHTTVPTTQSVVPDMLAIASKTPASGAVSTAGASSTSPTGLGASPDGCALAISAPPLIAITPATSPTTRRARNALKSSLLMPQDSKPRP